LRKESTPDKLAKDLEPLLYREVLLTSEKRYSRVPYQNTGVPHPEILSDPRPYPGPDP
jgi:hypothetical protein